MFSRSRIGLTAVRDDAREQEAATAATPNLIKE
jgi:hypothetical protein